MRLLDTTMGLVKPLSMLGLSALVEVALAAAPVKPGQGNLHQNVTAQAQNQTQNDTQPIPAKLQEPEVSYSLLAWTVALGAMVLTASVLLAKKCLAKPKEPIGKEFKAARQQVTSEVTSAKTPPLTLDQKRFNGLVDALFTIDLFDSGAVMAFAKNVKAFTSTEEKIRDLQLPCLQNIFALVEATNQLICHGKNNVQSAAVSKKTLNETQVILEKQIKDSSNKRISIGSNQYSRLHYDLYEDVLVSAKVALIESKMNRLRGSINQHLDPANKKVQWVAQDKETSITQVKKWREAIKEFKPKNEGDFISNTEIVCIEKKIAALDVKLNALLKGLQEITFSSTK